MDAILFCFFQIIINSGQLNDTGQVINYLYLLPVICSLTLDGIIGNVRSTYIFVHDIPHWERIIAPKGLICIKNNHKWVLSGI